MLPEASDVEMGEEANCGTGDGHCGYRSIKHRRRRRRREEVSLILRGNWSLPTVHKGHTPYMGCFPFQRWVGCGVAVEADPPLHNAHIVQYLLLLTEKL